MKHSLPSVPGLFLAPGNVGHNLTSYYESNMFLTRDGLTWEEIQKGTYVWAFGDSGSVLVMALDNVPTKHVLYSIDEGLHWRTYHFSDIQLYVEQIITTVPEVSRRLTLLARDAPRGSESLQFAVHLDFTGLTDRVCECHLCTYGITDIHAIRNQAC